MAELQQHKAMLQEDVAAFADKVCKVAWVSPPPLCSQVVMDGSPQVESEKFEKMQALQLQSRLTGTIKELTTRLERTAQQNAALKQELYQWRLERS